MQSNNDDHISTSQVSIETAKVSDFFFFSFLYSDTTNFFGFVSICSFLEYDDHCPAGQTFSHIQAMIFPDSSMFFFPCIVLIITIVYCLQGEKSTGILWAMIVSVKKIIKATILSVKALTRLTKPVFLLNKWLKLY